MTTTRARGPQVLKGALVTTSQTNPTPQVIAFQYNPATLRRNLQPQIVGGEENDRSQAVRFTGAPVQILTVDVDFDAADALNDNNSTAIQYGIYPQLSALELLVYPSLTQIQQNQTLLASGTLEVAPLTAPSTLFVWGSHRVLPVRLNSYSISEELFDARLNPIGVTVTLEMRVLNYSDLTSSNSEYGQFLAYQRSLVNASQSAISTSTQSLGVNASQL